LGELHRYDGNISAGAYPVGAVIAVMGGVRATAIARSRSFYGGLSVVYESSLNNSEGGSFRLWRPGAVLGWGAPYGEGWFGVSGAGGLVFSSTSETILSEGATAGPAGGTTTVTPGSSFARQEYDQTQYFGELAVHAKLPVVFGQQPFASLSGALVTRTAQPGPGALLGLELGVVWHD
jgi:hypothetical protein